MAFTPEEADYYHDRGMMPDWAWVQQNGRSPEWNWEYQHRKMMEDIKKRERAKQREEAKKQIEQQILDAIVFTMNEGADTVAEAAAADIISSIEGLGSGGKSMSKKSSFSAELGVILGKALGVEPFKLLDEIFKEDD